jgi:hypothetical protein
LGELWQGVLAFAPEETDLRDGEPMIEVGHKATVLGFDEEGTMQVVPMDRTYEPGRQFIIVRQIRLQQRSFANLLTKAAKFVAVPAVPFRARPS